MIRKAKESDAERIIVLINKFFNESLSYYGLRFNQETILETVFFHIKNHIVFVAEEDNIIVGVIGGVIAKSLFDRSQDIAQETMWYVDPEYRGGIVGIRLIKAFEKECKNLGANFIVMIHMSNLYSDTLHRFYKIHGYTFIEQHYIKEI